MNKDVRKLIQSLTVIDGVTVEVNGSHAKVYKDGKMVSVLPKTPSDHRWRDNALRDLRANGITPSAKIDKAFRYSEGLSQEEVREALLAMKAQKGTRAAFGRFLVDEVQPMLGLDGYKNFRSAEASLHIFAEQGGGLSEEKYVVVAEALRLWPAKQRFSTDKVIETEPEIVEPVVAEPMPVVAPEPSGTMVTLELDVDRLNELLAHLGIRLAMNPGSC